MDFNTLFGTAKSTSSVPTTKKKANSGLTITGYGAPATPALSPVSTPNSSGASRLTVQPSNVSATSPSRQKYTDSLVTPTAPSAPGPVQPQTNTTPSGAQIGANGQVTNAPVAPKEDPMDRYRSAFDSYLSSLQPSSEETAASKYLSDLQLQSKRDQETALNRGETLGFASGEAARVNRNNAFQIEGASNALNALTSSRQAQNKGQEARLSFEENALNRGDKLVASEADRAFKERQFTEDQRQANQSYDLSQQKFDEDRRQFGMEYALKARETSIKEGESGTGGKLSVEEAKARQFATAADQANSILGALNYNPGSLTFGLGELPIPNTAKSADRQQFEQASRALVNAVLRRESGAALTDDEFKNKFKELIPKSGDSQAVKDQKALARASAIRSIQEAGRLQSSSSQQGFTGGFLTSSPDGQQVIIID